LIFLDSSFIIALADVDDQFHEDAINVIPRLGAHRVISGLVISESVTAVGARLGAKAARHVFDNLLYDSATKTIFCNKRLYERAMPIYTKYGGKLSIPDSVTVRIMYDQKIKEIASFDSDFDSVDHLTRIS
jgi:predicted nucleic acid-binding protein